MGQSLSSSSMMTDPPNLVMPFASSKSASRTPLDTVEARSFFSRRLALFSLVNFLLSILFYVVSLVLGQLLGTESLGQLLSQPAYVAHIVGAVFSLTMWLFVRGRVLRANLAQYLDASLIIVIFTCYTVMSIFSLAKYDQRADLTLVLIVMSTLTLRSALIPSSTRRTILLGVVGSAGVLAVAGVIVQHIPEGQAMQGVALFIYITLWCLASVSVAAVTSHVLFGLRRQVQHAEKLGQYILEEKIGEGGMGIVYRARHALLRRPTAIKLLPPERAGTLNLTRFEREVQLTARLNNPNTIAIYDFGHTLDGVFYYAMELLDGLNLEELVESCGPQSEPRVAHILVQVCGALAEAHGIGLVHRDIKPANIILCERGGIFDVAKLLDFRLVKNIETPDPALSRADSIVGTPLYICPEALTSPEEMDGRSDLYSLGCTAYRLLTGTPVFSGSLIEVCSLHLHETPEPPSERLGRSVNPALEKLIMSCLEKRPKDRPQSASQLAKGLQHMSLGEWTNDDARGWWERERSHAARQPAAESSGTTATQQAPLTIDLERHPA